MLSLVSDVLWLLLKVELVIGAAGTAWLLVADRAFTSGTLGEGWEVPVNVVLTVVVVMLMWPFVLVHWLEQRDVFRWRIG